MSIKNKSYKYYLQKLLNPCNFYVILWIVYYFQMKAEGTSALKSGILFLYIGVCVFYVIFAVKNFRLTAPLKALLVVTLLLFINCLLTFLFSWNRQFEAKSFLVIILTSIGPIFPFFVFSKQGLLTESLLRHYFFLFVVVCTISYKIEAEMVLMRADYRYEERTNNEGYFFVGLLPFVFLFRKRPILQYAIMSYCMFYVISSYKRGAILTGALMIMWIIYISLQKAKIGRKIVILIITAIFLNFGIEKIQDIYLSSDYFQQRMYDTQRGDSSGRDILFVSLGQHFMDNNFFHLIFGEGALATHMVTGGTSAHNDWLEILIDGGLIVAFSYLVYWFLFARDVHKKRDEVVLYGIGGACFIFTFIRTFFSMSYFDMPFYTSAIMGYVFQDDDCIKWGNMC